MDEKKWLFHSSRRQRPLICCSTLRLVVANIQPLTHVPGRVVKVKMSSFSTGMPRGLRGEAAAGPGCARAKPCSPQDSKSRLGSLLCSFPLAVLFGSVDNLSNSCQTTACPSTSAPRGQEEMQGTHRAGWQGHQEYY